MFAGALDFDDAVRLVDIRGRAMQECAEQRPGTMLAVLGVDRDQLVALCDECRGADVLEVANVLCPGNIVVSGASEACRRLDAAAVAAGAMKCVPLEVAGAFHTSLMQPAVERPFLALRETLGAAWTLRIAERFNATAAARGWPCRLRFGGLDVGGDVGDQRWQADAIRTARALVRRFASDDWLRRHGGEAKNP